MREYILKILDIIPTNWFKSLFIIFILTLFNAIFELLGIGMVIPFLSVFLNENNSFLSQVNFLNNYTKDNLILIFLAIFILIFILKNFFSVLIQKKKINFSHNVATELSSKLYLKYLKKKYIYFTLRNTSDLIRNIVDEANLFSFGVVVGVLNLIIDLIIFLTITIFLFFYNPIASTIAFIVMVLLGYITIYFQHNKLKSFGLKRQIHSGAIIKLINESIGNIKEIILSGTHNFFENKFKYHVMENAKSGKGKDYYFIIPRPILEVVAVFMIFILVYALTYFQHSSSDILITAQLIGNQVGSKSSDWYHSLSRELIEFPNPEFHPGMGTPFAMFSDQVLLFSSSGVLMDDRLELKGSAMLNLDKKGTMINASIGYSPWINWKFELAFIQFSGDNNDPENAFTKMENFSHTRLGLFYNF